MRSTLHSCFVLCHFTPPTALVLVALSHETCHYCQTCAHKPPKNGGNTFLTSTTRYWSSLSDPSFELFSSAQAKNERALPDTRRSRGHCFNSPPFRGSHSGWKPWLVSSASRGWWAPATPTAGTLRREHRFSRCPANRIASDHSVAA